MDSSNFAKVQIDHHKDQTIVHLKALIGYYQDSSLSESDFAYLNTINDMVKALSSIFHKQKSSASGTDTQNTPTPICQQKNQKSQINNENYFQKVTIQENHLNNCKNDESFCTVNSRRNIKKKRKGIFVASSPDFQKKSFSCQDLLDHKQRASQNCQSRVSKKSIFKRNNSEKKISVRNVDFQLNYPNKLSLKKFENPYVLLSPKLKLSQRKQQIQEKGKQVDTLKRQTTSDWKKVVNTTDKASSFMRVKKVDAFQNDILNPKEMRDLIMKKRIKIENQNKNNLLKCPTASNLFLYR